MVAAVVHHADDDAVAVVAAAAAVAAVVVAAAAVAVVGVVDSVAVDAGCTAADNYVVHVPNFLGTYLTLLSQPYFLDAP